MSGLRNILLLSLPIPIVFTVGIVAFFYIIPSNSQNLSNFIGYTSSLATILMVLVVIVTTMLQTKEIALSRMHQIQPFLAVIPSNKSSIEKMTLFMDVPQKISDLGRRLFFIFEIENVGNGPAVAVKIFAKLVYSDENKKEKVISPPSEEYELLKTNDKRETEIMFVEETNAKTPFWEYLLKGYFSDRSSCGYGYYSRCNIEMAIYYKNALGAAFKEEICFEVFLKLEDKEKIKAALKLFNDYKIDKREDMAKIDSLTKTDEEKAENLVKQMNEEISKQDGAAEILLDISSPATSISNLPISDSDYKKAIERDYEEKQ